MVCCGQHNLSMDFSLSARCLRIYYLPGHGGRITNGLGQALVSRGYEVVGRETVGDFKKLDFNDQVITIANDKKNTFGARMPRSLPTHSAAICCFMLCRN